MKKYVTIAGAFCALLLAFGLQLYARQFGEQAYQFALANTAGYIFLCGGILFTMSYDRLELVQKLEGLYMLIYALFFLILAWGAHDVWTGMDAADAVGHVPVQPVLIDSHGHNGHRHACHPAPGP